jgi:peptide methionine sulfoxide reductase MsrB
MSDNALVQIALGSEVRCAKCGGHLGDVFADGLLFPGTMAALTGKRFCIDGTSLYFEAADGSARVSGESKPYSKPADVELPSWLQPPPVPGSSKPA